MYVYEGGMDIYKSSNKCSFEKTAASGNPAHTGWQSYFPRIHFINMALVAHLDDSPALKDKIKIMKISTQIAKEILEVK